MIKESTGDVNRLHRLVQVAGDDGCLLQRLEPAGSRCLHRGCARLVHGGAEPDPGIEPRALRRDHEGGPADGAEGLPQATAAASVHRGRRPAAHGRGGFENPGYRTRRPARSAGGIDPGPTRKSSPESSRPSERWPRASCMSGLPPPDAIGGPPLSEEEKKALPGVFAGVAAKGLTFEGMAKGFR